MNEDVGVPAMDPSIFIDHVPEPSNFERRVCAEMLEHREDGTIKPMGYACVFRLVGEQNNCL